MSALTGIVPRLSGRSGNLECVSGASLARLRAALVQAIRLPNLAWSSLIASIAWMMNQSLQSLSDQGARIIDFARPVSTISWFDRAGGSFGRTFGTRASPFLRLSKYRH